MRGNKRVINNKYKGKHRTKAESFIRKAIITTIISMILSTFLGPYFFQIRDKVFEILFPPLEYEIEEVKLLNKSDYREKGFRMNHVIGDQSINVHTAYLEMKLNIDSNDLSSPNYLYVFPPMSKNDESIKENRMQRYALNIQHQVFKVNLELQQYVDEKYCDIYLAFKDKNTGKYFVNLILLKSEELPVYTQLISEQSEINNMYDFSIKAVNPNIKKRDLSVIKLTEEQLDSLDLNSEKYRYIYVNKNEYRDKLKQIKEDLRYD
ncbi:hypothetical protein [Enterococcus faecium]|uniref:hypothetical protein n=2 Tax=Enterococcus faecium TaxID=1352 RepID=UPI002891CF72|nr:hypothetical protein [Enterococcus faecium]MDT2316642.1 hypothetical protein [Enterococcus faecium]